MTTTVVLTKRDALSRGMDHLDTLTQSQIKLEIVVRFPYRFVEAWYVLEKSSIHETISEAFRP